MSRKIPTCPEIPRLPKPKELSYEINLLTPMFGGGVDAGKPDPTMPFRTTAIRGQLQFWWRATAGASYSNVDDLIKKHSDIWGNTKGASKVKIVVENMHSGTPECFADQFRSSPGISYVLFPFVGKQPPAMFFPNGSFTLRIICPECFCAEVQTAVRAWVNFGGMGARTRRGCGSIFCKELAPRTVEEAAGLVRAILPDPPGGEPKWSILSGPLLAGNEGDPITAWDSAIGALRKFRQGEGFARGLGRNGRPGRSRWPEPETIRDITGRRSDRHQRMEGIPKNAFPRAELGLPIIFHFKDLGEPADTTLYPLVADEKYDRMASPLIIKALGLANGKAVPICLRLRTPVVETVQLDGNKNGNKVCLHKTDNLRGGYLATYPNSPMAGTPSGSALDAFMNFIQDEDTWDVLK